MIIRSYICFIELEFQSDLVKKVIKCGKTLQAIPLYLQLNHCSYTLIRSEDLQKVFIVMYFFEKEKCLNYHFVYFFVTHQNLKCKFDIIHNDIRSEFRIK